MTPEDIEKAKEMGADLVGVASVAESMNSPSHAISERIADFGTVGTRSVEGRKKGHLDCGWSISAGKAPSS